MSTPTPPLGTADPGPAELTPRALLLGTLLGVLFGASSLYLVLKVGLTVSASIPVAVISIALFRIAAGAGFRDATTHEHVAVQTAGSAGESIAFGIGVTMPAILILGFDLEIWRVMLVATLGGLLGILMMLPLRRTLIVAQQRELPFPEGTACAKVLLAAQAARAGNAPTRAVSGARTVFVGFVIGLGYKIANIALKGWKDVASWSFGAPYKGASLGIEVSPELLGVGYIVGPRIAATLCAGGVLAYLVLMPMIYHFGSGLEQALAPGTKPIRDMAAGELRGAYVLYVGAGAVAMGGLTSLVRALPLIARSLRQALLRLDLAASSNLPRTEQEIALKWVFSGWAVLLAAITAAPPLQMNLLGALLIAACGFLFCTVSARLTGEIGSSSNPISGMTIATLLITCLTFRALGWTAPPYLVTALSIGAIVCIASANAGTTAQDLKTGFLVGATPRAQQIAILVGSLISALALGPVLLSLNAAATVYVPAAKVAPGLYTTELSAATGRESLQGPQAADDRASYRVWHKTDERGGPAGKYLVDEEGRTVWLVDPGINGTHTQRPDGSEVRKYDAPKAVLVSYLIKGILQGELPWALVIAGALIALVLEMAGVASLAFAVGLYLPLATSAPILVGGMLRAWRDRGKATADHEPGLLLASGYIAGGALAGIVIAIGAGVLVPFDAALTAWAGNHNPLFSGPESDRLSLLPFSVIALLLMLYSRGRSAQ